MEAIQIKENMSIDEEVRPGLLDQLTGADYQKNHERLPSSFPVSISDWTHLANSRDRSSPLGLLFFSIDNIHAFNWLYGDDVYAHSLIVMENTLKTQTADLLELGDTFYFEKVDAASYVVVLEKKSLNLEHLVDIGTSIIVSSRPIINMEVFKLTGQNLDIRMGYALVRHRNGGNIANSFYYSLCEARNVAAGTHDFIRAQMMDEFKDIIETPRLEMVFQPIADLSSSKPLGWEALARGPEKSRFHSPSVLFDFAEEAGLLFQLERVCREQAIANIGRLKEDQKLFLNIHPRTVADPSFTAGQTMKLIKEYGLEPNRVVFEITERHPIRDFTLFFKTIEHYRSQGYMIAIDDVGAGYSGLWTIANLRPDFIKLDMSLTRNVDSNPIHRALVETLLTLADKIGCQVIAEGIETATELSTLADLGLKYGQGFYLARPQSSKSEKFDGLPVKASFRPGDILDLPCSLPIRELVEPALSVDAHATTSEVQDMIANKSGNPISAAVVVSNDKPIGLVMSYHLHRKLGSRFGVALYYERTIAKLMDTSPLIIEEQTPVEIAAEMAMRRERFKVYDHVIVTRGGRLTGLVSVQKMLDTLARVQVEMAKGANPLTGLPGNVSIEKQTLRIARTGQITSVIYADIDNFKIFNDRYGFEKGDRIILLLSRILSWAVKKYGGPDGFLGHIGGDDFVILTSPDQAQRLCQAVCRCFQRLAPQCYSAEDRRNGYICAVDRSGEERRIPLMTISMAIIDCPSGFDLKLISQRSAEMKKYAKSIEGNSYVRDRRQIVDSECSADF